MSELGGGDFLQGFASGALGSLGAAGLGATFFASPAAGWLVGTTLSYTTTMADHVIFNQMAPAMGHGFSNWYGGLTNKLIGTNPLR